MSAMQPRKIVEVGSGFSSAAMIDINEKSFNREIHLTFVDPYPERLLKLLPTNSEYRDRSFESPSRPSR